MPLLVEISQNSRLTPKSEIGGPHSRVWRWYAGSIDLSLTQFESGLGGEPIFRSLKDGNLGFPFGSLDVPYYVAHEYLGTPRFQYGVANAVWEGIGTGWAFSPSGGAVFQGTTITTGKNPQIDDNADDTVKSIVNPFGVAVESVFNGTFEHGNIHRGQRFPSNEIETPGWSLHGGDFQSDLASSTTFTVREDAPGNHVAELNSLPIYGNSQITHNRFYIPQTALSLQFSTRVQEKELFRTGRLTASVSLDGTNFQSIGSFDVTATSSQYTTHTFLLNTTSLGNVVGKMGYIRFELTHPGGGLQVGTDRVYIDNVRLLGVGLPIQTEASNTTTNNPPIPIGQMALTTLTDAARSQWQGLVEAPNGIGGSTLGDVGITAPDFLRQDSIGTSTEDKETNRNAGSGEGRLDNQLLLTHPNTFFAEKPSSNQQPALNEFGLNGNSAFASNRHAVDTGPDAGLTEVENAGFLNGIVDEGRSAKAKVKEYRTSINESTIGVVNFDINTDLPTPGGQGAAADFEVFNFKKFSLAPFMQLSTVFGHGDQFISAPPCSMLHPA